MKLSWEWTTTSLEQLLSQSATISIFVSHFAAMPKQQELFLKDFGRLTDAALSIRKSLVSVPK